MEPFELKHLVRQSGLPFLSKGLFLLKMSNSTLFLLKMHHSTPFFLLKCNIQPFFFAILEEIKLPQKEKTQI